MKKLQTLFSVVYKLKIFNIIFNTLAHTNESTITRERLKRVVLKNRYGNISIIICSLLFIKIVYTQHTAKKEDKDPIFINEK